MPLDDYQEIVVQGSRRYATWQAWACRAGFAYNVLGRMPGKRACHAARNLPTINTLRYASPHSSERFTHGAMAV